MLSQTAQNVKRRKLLYAVRLLAHTRKRVMVADMQRSARATKLPPSPPSRPRPTSMEAVRLDSFSISDMRHRLVEAAMKRHGNDMKAAASTLGISEAQLRRLCREHAIAGAALLH